MSEFGKWDGICPDCPLRGIFTLRVRNICRRMVAETLENMEGGDEYDVALARAQYPAVQSSQTLVSLVERCLERRINQPNCFSYHEEIT